MEGVMKKIVFVFFILFIFSSPLFAGEIYTYKDKDGNTVISNTQIPEKYEKKAKEIEGKAEVTEPSYALNKTRTEAPNIERDTKRRAPSFSNKVLGAIPFRYDEESIHGRLFRYDRFNKTVEQRYGTDENTFKWEPRPQFKNLQHVRDFMAQWERNSQQSETDRKNKELKRSVEDLKNSVESMKREQEDRDSRERMNHHY
jgi:hypothetical protein